MSKKTKTQKVKNKKAKAIVTNDRADAKLDKNSDEKVMRLAHAIFTKTIMPSKVSLDEAIDVAIVLLRAIVVSNTEKSDQDDRAELLSNIEDRFVEMMDDLNPDAEKTHVWIVPPQGLITEPVGFLWSGEDVHVIMGAELVGLRAELAEPAAADDAIVTEGVEGLAMTDPTWDGNPTITCENPECGRVHDVHLMVAENLFQQAKQQPSAPN